MSSSLKERLKKCGRYHPATPPSNLQTAHSPGVSRVPVPSLLTESTSSSRHHSTPTSGLSTTPVPSSPPESTSSSRYCSTPTRCHRDSNSRTDGSTPRSRGTFPQPRNILKEKCVLSNHMETDSENLKSSVEPRLGYKTCSTVDKKREKRESGWGGAQEEVGSDAEGTDCRPQTEGLSVVNTTSVTACEQTASAECERNSCSDKGDAVQEPSVVAILVDWREVKKTLTADLAQKKETLRKLHMVRTYRTKHHPLALQGLIGKWRSTCQQAVLDLHHLTSDPRPSLTQLVRQLGVDQRLVRYDAEDECFEED
ncbi:hypothetical protein ACOMHN_017319 [Nucella lapillus]